jgi:serine/threonine protein phosphatase PrpC
MGFALKVSVGQHSDKGRKAVNQDFYGVSVPEEPLLSSKGIAVALADGIGSSEVSQIASEFAVMGFLDDYYCTSEAWSVKKSVERVLAAINSWLHSRTRQSEYRYDKDRGYVCTR